MQARPAPSSHHPWRTIAVVVGGVATLELLILVIVGIALVAKPMAHRAIAHAAKAPAAAKPKPEPSAAAAAPLTSVTVLNGNGVSGAAAPGGLARARARVQDPRRRQRAARQLLPERRHVPAGRIREARRLARDVGIAIVSPLDGLRKRDLHGAKLAVVVGG